MSPPGKIIDRRRGHGAASPRGVWHESTFQEQGSAGGETGHSGSEANASGSSDMLALRPPAQQPSPPSQAVDAEPKTRSGVGQNVVRKMPAWAQAYLGGCISCHR